MALKTENPAAVPINGGTDLMVQINFARRRPSSLLDLSQLDTLKRWTRSNGMVELGAGVTYTDVLEHLGSELPALAIASRTVGSPQCGLCTPGLILATHCLLETNPDPSDDEIREALAGNLCRCTGYEKIVSAVRLAALEMAVR